MGFLYFCFVVFSVARIESVYGEPVNVTCHACTKDNNKQCESQGEVTCFSDTYDCDCSSDTIRSYYNPPEDRVLYNSPTCGGNCDYVKCFFCNCTAGSTGECDKWTARCGGDSIEKPCFCGHDNVNKYFGKQFNSGTPLETFSSKEDCKETCNCDPLPKTKCLYCNDKSFGCTEREIEDSECPEREDPSDPDSRPVFPAGQIRRCSAECKPHQEHPHDSLVELYQEHGKTYTFRPPNCAASMGGYCETYRNCCIDECKRVEASTMEFWCLKYHGYHKFSLGCVCITSGPGKNQTKFCEDPCYEGDEGPKGDMGAPGERGHIGDHGIKGNIGCKGEKGHVGEQGTCGAKGEEGEDGNDGGDGNDGNKGAEGAKGLPGKKGPTGMPGPQGDDGIKGYEGYRGAKGPAGDPGSAGVFGDEGPKGQEGVQGSTGHQGEAGEPGEYGVEGAKGATAPDGLPGQTGPRGNVGDPGPEGDEGPKGEQGPEGRQGHRGFLGMPGEMGDKGVEGKPGKRGDPGEPGGAGTPLLGMKGCMGPKGDEGETLEYPKLETKEPQIG